MGDSPFRRGKVGRTDPRARGGGPWGRAGGRCHFWCHFSVTLSRQTAHLGALTTRRNRRGMSCADADLVGSSTTEHDGRVRCFVGLTCQRPLVRVQHRPPCKTQNDARGRPRAARFFWKAQCSAGRDDPAGRVRIASPGNSQPEIVTVSLILLYSKSWAPDASERDRMVRAFCPSTNGLGLVEML